MDGPPMDGMEDPLLSEQWFQVNQDRGESNDNAEYPGMEVASTYEGDDHMDTLVQDTEMEEAAPVNEYQPM